MTDMETKICTKCSCSKPATTEFFPKQLNGLFSWCRECKREWQRTYNKSEAGIESQKKYNKTPKGKKNNFEGTKRYQRKLRGIYGIFDTQSGDCLYIGRSSQFNGRVLTHKYCINNLEQAHKHHPSMYHLYELLSHHHSVSYRLLGEFVREELNMQESEFIDNYKPIYNIYKNDK
jgi:hypothetical protein